MKNLFVILLGVALLQTPDLRAQSDGGAQLTEKRFNLSIDPLAMVFLFPVPSLNMAADFKISEHALLGAILSPTYFMPSSGGGFGLGTQLEIFPISPVFMSGWYVKPQAQMRGAFDSGSSRWTSVLSLTSGYHWFFDKGFNLALGAGANYSSVVHNSLATTPASGFAPVLDVKVGYAF